MGLTFLTLAVIVLNLGATWEPTLMRPLDVADTPRNAANFAGSSFSACDPQDGRHIQPSTDLHCQFDTNVMPQATLRGCVPDQRTAYFPTEICRAGTTVDVCDKPPNLEVRS